MKELFKRWQKSVANIQTDIGNLGIAIDDFQASQKETAEYKDLTAAVEKADAALNDIQNKIDAYSKISARIRKVPIKFRGKITNSNRHSNGQYVYGWYSEGFNDDGKLVPRIIYDAENPACWCEVEPDSVVQLVGYDANANEIYEGDEVGVYRGAFRKLGEGEKPYDIAIAKLTSEVGSYGELNAYDDYQFLKL